MVRWDQVLAVVSLVLGLPSLIALYVSGPPALAVAGMLIAVAFLGAAWYVHSKLNKPAISVDFQRFKVNFTENRKVAKITKEYEFRVHRKDLTQWVHRNITSDGHIDNLCWNGAPIPAGDIIVRCNDHQVITRNPYPWPVGKKLQGTLSYDLVDSFPAAVEYVQYTSDIPTKVAIVRIELAPGDRCTTAYVRRRAAGVEETMDLVERDPNGTWLQFKIKRPKGGHEYTLFWHW